MMWSIHIYLNLRPFSRLFVVLVAAGGILAGCHAPSDAQVTIYSVQGPVHIQLEVARTDQEKTQGLMGRPSLAEGKGMIFLYTPKARPIMWMKNMLISLDMIFIGSDGTINHVAQNVAPCRFADDSKCPRYQSDKESAYVLELPAGYTRKAGVAAGDAVRLWGIN